MRPSQRLIYDDQAAAAYLLARLIEHVPRVYLADELLECSEVEQLVGNNSRHGAMARIIRAELQLRNELRADSNMSPGQLSIDQALADTWRDDLGAGHRGNRRSADGPGDDPARPDGTRAAETAQWPDDTGYGG